MARIEMRTRLFSYIILHNPCGFGQDMYNTLRDSIASADLSYIICSNDVENICILCLNCLAFCTLSRVSIRMLCWIVKCWAFLLSHAFRPKPQELTYTNPEPSEQEPEQSGQSEEKSEQSEEKSQQSEDIVDISQQPADSSQQTADSDEETGYESCEEPDREEIIREAIETAANLQVRLLCRRRRTKSRQNTNGQAPPTAPVAEVGVQVAEGGTSRKRVFFICLAVCLSVSIVGNVFLLLCSYLLYAAQGYHRYDPLID